jgi:phage tail P2-like protein
MANLLPPNATALERAIEAAVNDAIEAVAIPLRDLWNPQRCPVTLLPWLAWALSVDNWNTNWPEDVKRDVIAQSIKVHRHKGTIGALRRAINALGHGIQVREWHQYGGQVYRFRLEVELTERGLTEAEQSEIILTAQQAKNARSWLESLTLYLTSRGQPHYAAALQSGDDCTVYPYTLTELEQRVSVPVVALGVYGVETTTLYPR